VVHGRPFVATQQNAALVEEATAAADSVNGQAQRLVGAVGSFRLEPAA
jgi:methyl-accepting chemotaxis protein